MIYDGSHFAHVFTNLVSCFSEFSRVFPTNQNESCLFVVIFFPQRHLICSGICENLEFGIREIIMRTLKNSFWIPQFFLVIKFVFSKKATKIDKIFTVDLTFYLVSVKSTVKIFSIFVAFLENTNFTFILEFLRLLSVHRKCQETNLIRFKTFAKARKEFSCT